MLSFENLPPDPSNLNNTNSDDLNKLDDENTHLPNFSIRDYVFNARIKDIKTNWPFSEKKLQLCLKHGVKDLLPPFQTTDSVKNRKSCPVISSILPIDPENICNNSDKVQASSSHKATIRKSTCQKVIGETATSEIMSNSQACFTSVPTNRISNQFVPSKFEKISRSSSKKCKVIVKFNTILNQTSTTEDLSETVTSIVCPVCKTFSSSSNTTLNAHIDQCLSVEPTCKWTNPDSKRITSSSPKYRIKPRKMRSMVDIIATAPRCTLEELDRRNGSSWAVGTGTGSVLAIQNDDQVNSKGKKQMSSRVFTEDNGDKSEVYFDSKGTKIRILSKFNNGSLVARVEENPRKSEVIKEGGKGEHVISINEKKHHIVRHQKFININKNINMSSPKACSSSQIHENNDEDYEEEGYDRYDEKHPKQKLEAQAKLKPNYSKSLRPRNLEKIMTTQNLGAQEKIKSSDLGTFKPRILEKHLIQNLEDQAKVTKSSDSGMLRKWVSAKRTCISKKIKKKDLNFKKSKVRYAEEMDEDYDFMLKNKIEKMMFKKGSFSRSSVQKNKPKRGATSNYETDNIISDREFVIGLEKDGKSEFSRRKLNFNGRENVDEQFSKMDEKNDNYSSDTGSDYSRHSVEEHRGLLYEAESPVYMGDENTMFCDDQIDEGINGQKYYMESETGPGFDPIPIPSPPGSFLPSPRDMGSEDLINSPHDQYQTVDRVSLDSPISATSTVSHLNCSEDFVKSMKLHEQENVQYNFNSEVVVPENVTGVAPPATNISSDAKGLNFRDDDHHPCCCSRKERFSSGISLNFQESQLLKRRNTVSSMLVEPEQQINCFQTNQNLGPGKFYSSTNVKIPNNFDPDSASPSVSTPILRLMGKNLMVVNNEENSIHRQDSQPCSSSPNDQSSLRFSKSSSGNIQNQNLNHNVHQEPMNMMNQNQCFDSRLSNNSFKQAGTDFGSRNVNPYSYPPQMAAQHSYFYIPNSNPVFWTRQTRPYDGYTELQHGAFMAASTSSTNQLRPALNFSPKLS